MSNNLNLTNHQSHIQMKGEVTIDVLDAETLEIKRTIKTTNSITKVAAFWFSSGFGIVGEPSSTYSYSTHQLSNNSGTGAFSMGLSTPWGSAPDGTLYNRIVLTWMKYHPDTHCVGHLPSYYTPNTTLIPGQFVAASGSLPDSLLVKQRFNAPASTRTIWTISLFLQDGTGGYPLTLAPLSTPCIQTNTEILDVSYRILYYYTPIQDVDLPFGNQISASDSYSQGMLLHLTARHPYNLIRYYSLMPNKLHDKSMNYRSWGNPGYSDSTRATWINQRLSTSNMNLSWGITTGVGRLIQSIYTRPVDASANTPWTSFGAFDKFGNDTFTNKPIQPVYLHSSPSTIPFADSNNTGSSIGSLSINGDNWTNPKFPDYYKLTLTKSGAAGTSAYYFNKRLLTGYNGNSYEPRQYHSSFTDSYPGSWYVKYDTFVGMHGSSKYYPTQWEEYNSTKFVMFNDSRVGISIIDIADGEAVNFDATTTPALPVTGLRQVATNFSNGDVWVACKNTGLYRIQNPFISPTITHFDTFDSFTNMNNVYAVSMGYNNCIWIAFEGGLAKSTNDGFTWQVYNTTSTPAFDKIGITDSNWARIYAIRTDIRSPNDDLCIVYGNTNTYTTLYTCWWSQTLAATSGPNVGRDDSPYSRYWVVRCCPYSSAWIMTTYLSNQGPNTQLKLYKFGTNAMLVNYNSGDTVPTTTSSHTGNYNISFYYDYYNTPYIIVNNRTSSFNYNTLKDIRGNTWGSIIARVPSGSLGTSSSDNDWQVYHGSFGFNACYNKSPLVHTNNRTTTMSGANGNISWDYTTGGFKPIWPGYSQTFGSGTSPGYTIDDENGEYTPFQEILIKKYHWNPNTTQWQQNYYAPAIDSSSYAINATRHNFDTESHQFTGRSLIDVTNSITTGSINNIATFAFTVNSLAKVTSKYQETTSTLLSLEDDNQAFRIVWTNGTNMVIDHGLTSGTTTALTVATASAAGTTFRIIVVLNGTTCQVYKDNVLLNTLTISNFNFSSPSPYFKAYLGAQVYYRPFNSTYPMPWGFFRGSITNFQMWNVAWDATDVANDFSNISGVISSKPNANLLTRLQLTEPLVETKLTHNTPEVLVDGVTIGFNDNVSSPANSFIATDYYTFGVVDGLLKDNSTSFNHSFTTYNYADVNVNFNDIKNSIGTNVISPITTPISIPVHCYQYPLTPGTGGSQFNTLHSAGQFNLFSTQIGGSAQTTSSYEVMVGDGQFDFYLQHSFPVGMYVGLSTNINVTATVADYHYSIFFDTDSVTARIRLGSTTNVGTAYSFNGTEKYTIKRVGNIITFLIDDVLWHTVNSASTNPLQMRLWHNSTTGRSQGIVNAKMTLTSTNNIMFVGNVLNSTGCFNKTFIQVDATNVNSCKFYIDGILAPVTVSNTYLTSMAIPAVGAITFSSLMGLLLFNPADVGKVVTGTCITVSDIL